MRFDDNKVLMLVMSKYKVDPRPRRQAEALAAAGKRVEVLYCNEEGGQVSETFHGVELRRVRFPCTKSRLKIGYMFNYISFFFCAMLMVSWRFLVLTPPTLVIHSMPNFLVFAAWLPRLLGARVILDVHDIMPELFSSIFNTQRGFIYRLLFWEERLSCRFASDLMTANDLFAQTLQLRVGRSFYVVHNAPDDKFTNAGCQPLAQIKQRITLFHHGNIHRRCGIDQALPALASLKINYPQLALQVHGRGPFYAEVKQKAKQLAVDDICLFGEGFALEQLPTLLKNADIGLVINRVCQFTTLCMPIKLLEYVECKLPVICARMKTASFYFDDDCVYYVESAADIASVIEQIISHPEQAKAKADRAYERYCQISWQNCKPHYVAHICPP